MTLKQIPCMRKHTGQGLMWSTVGFNYFSVYSFSLPTEDRQLCTMDLVVVF